MLITELLSPLVLSVRHIVSYSESLRYLVLKTAILYLVVILKLNFNSLYRFDDDKY